ncbi:MAG: styrene monooxygenase/indole monooxygenase family protein [Trebonia sp.]
MFAPALDREREYRLNLWEEQAPKMLGISAALAPAPGLRAFGFYGPWDRYGNSVDQRVKMPAWLELFENRGGRVICHPVMTSDLAGLAAMYDLTVIAAGKGEIVELFDRDPARSRYTEPGRVLSAIYTHGMDTPADMPEPKVRVNIEPGVVETFTIPGLTMSGPCQITLVEAHPGGPFDVFRDRPRPDEHLRRLRTLMLEHFPWEGELYDRCEPTDSRASLSGAFTTTIRSPVAEVAPGVYVFGIADVVTVLDPIAGQGANCAAHSAGVYTRAILERGDKPFDPAWMRDTFETYWETQAQHSLALTTALLEPMPEHVQQILGAASQYPEIGKRFGDLFPYPADIYDFLFDPEKGLAYVASVAAAG